MYTSLFTPVISRIHPCSIEEVKHSVQKERRIIDTLEPVLNRHKLVFERQVIEDDYRTAQAYDGDSKFTKSLVYQMSRISYDKGALKHDDRLDALSIAVNYWAENMAQDDDRGIAQQRQDLLDKELEKFMDSAFGTRKAGSNNWNPLMGR